MQKNSGMPSDHSRVWPSLVLGLCGVLAAAFLPWFHSFNSFPNESMDVRNIYRGSPPGDIQYYPLIAQLAQGTLTDGSIKELEGSVFRSFPHGTLLFHAVGLALFGDYGFLAADVGVTVLYFLLLVALLRTFGISRPVSAFIGCVFALEIPVRLTSILTLGPISSAFSLITRIWGNRVPRPFVAELLQVLVFLIILRMLVSQRTTLKHWILLAIAYGWLLQGDIYSALIFAMISPILVVMVARKNGTRDTVRNCLVGGVFFLASISIFVCQRLMDHPDVQTRWGVFELGRLAGFEMYWRLLFSPGLAIAILCVTRFLLWPLPIRDETPSESEGFIQRTWWFIATLLLAAFSCGPISILLLGKTIQPYHFNDRAERLCGYIVIALIAIWIEALFKVLRTRMASPVLDRFGWHLTTYAGILALIIGFFLYDQVYPRTPYTMPVRHVLYEHLIDVEPTYRSSFAELTDHLKAEIPRDAVVASFDHQVFAWWMTFEGQYWFLVEPFVSSIPDDELEIRLLTLCKLLNVSADEFIEFLQIPIESEPETHGYANVFWLALAKYQASQFFTFAPLDEYTPDQQTAIASTDYVWQTIIPQNELARLRDRYEATSLDNLDSRQLDVIVLNNRGLESTWTPTGQWRMSFENDGFRVFVRKQ